MFDMGPGSKWVGSQWIASVALTGALLAATVMPAFASSPSHDAVVLLFDTSGSMRDNDPDCIRGDATRLLVSLLDEGDRLSIAEFGDGVRELTSGWLHVGSAAEKAKQLAQRCQAGDDYTNVVEALEHALELVEGLGAEGRRATPPTVILLTDGQDTAPDSERPTRMRRLDSVLEALAEYGVRVHSVALSNAADRTLLARIQNATGGDVNFADQPEDLLGSFFDLSRMLGRRWLIQDSDVAAGELQVTVPSWVRSGVALFVPRRAPRGVLSTEGREAMEGPTYQILRMDPLAAGSLELQVPEPGGRVVLDARGSIRLRLELGERIPSEVPFQCFARLLTPDDKALGTPEFLQAFRVFVRGNWVGVQGEQPLYDNGRHDDGKPGDGVFGGTCLVGTPPPDEPAEIIGIGRASYSPTLIASRKVEVLSRPVRMDVAGSGLLGIRGTGSVSLRNRTDVPIRLVTHVEADGKQIGSKRLRLEPQKPATVDVNVPRQTLAPTDVRVRVQSQDGKRTLLDRRETLWPKATLPLMLLAPILLLLLVTVLPRRSAKGIRTILEVENGHEGPKTLRRSLQTYIPHF